MLGKFWDLFIEYLKQRRYWATIQPLIILLGAYVVVHFLAYQYIAIQYGLRLSVGLFLTSYISTLINVSFLGIILLALLLRLAPRGEGASLMERLQASLRANSRGIIFRIAAVVVVGVLVAVGFYWFSPRRVSHIQVKFMERPKNFEVDALAYLLYELNRLQRNWYFEVDFKFFNPASLKSTEILECSGSGIRILCHAQKLAEGKPLIAITGEDLNGAYFAQHERNVSVISTVDSPAYDPLSHYEYLAYSVVVQSILIHLDVNGRGLPEGWFEPSELSHGGVFQHVPRREAMKAGILAARFSPGEEELLFNSFGPNYLRVCSELLSMEWVYSQRVIDNLGRHFGILLDVNRGGERPGG
jgi:hypothetical protein